VNVDEYVNEIARPVEFKIVFEILVLCVQQRHEYCFDEV
jgi:hypothetical protein